MDWLRLNLIAAWVGILLGFGSGLAMGLFFHREDWLGGYSSHKRRLYRLAHISFFGLGAVNLCFYFTALRFGQADVGIRIASLAFIIGLASMPSCCVLMAQFPRARLLFAVPVIALALGAMITLAAIIRMPSNGFSLATHSLWTAHSGKPLEMVNSRCSTSSTNLGFNDND